MFKRESSEHGHHYNVGMIDEIVDSHDKQVRNIWIKYKIGHATNGIRVERDIKSIFKLLKPEETTLHSMLERAAELVKQTLEAKREEITPAKDGADTLNLDDDGPGSNPQLDMSTEDLEQSPDKTGEDLEKGPGMTGEDKEKEDLEKGLEKILKKKREN